MQIRSIDLNKLRGLSDKGLGLAKEFLGTVTNRDAWVEEGEAQQARGAEQLRALRAEAKAERHEAEADVHEQRQKAAQRAKSA